MFQRNSHGSNYDHQRYFPNQEFNRPGFSINADLNRSGYLNVNDVYGVNHDLNRSSYAMNVDMNRSSGYINPDLNRSGYMHDLSRSIHPGSPEYEKTNVSNNQFNIGQTSPRRTNSNFLTGGLMKHSDIDTSATVAHIRQPPPPPQENKKLKRSETINYGRSNDPPTKSLREVRPFLNYTLACGQKSILFKKDHEKTHPYAFKKYKDKYTNDDEDLEYWVTVYGYDKKQANRVLAMFSDYGEIVAKKISNTSNYMHIKYSDKLVAHSVRNRNGTMFENTMIGVKATTDLRLVDDDFPFKRSNACKINGDVKFEPLKDGKENADPTMSAGLKKNFIDLTRSPNSSLFSTIRTSQPQSILPFQNQWKILIVIIFFSALFTSILLKIF